ncbi:DotH/IcmK family type IV secretion protein [Xenorhabdus sp. KJ12.1]|uniref:DotH/IcmK family type IV secretion protein n=1 Tax=Xenorhabdus sp. KJ12.1 TaxID=1851571 RepID=UPI000C0529EE|nr:DotH/IcmK family type IV secretion protein [Xenorhabdus sp. KJ12.1]PHM67997.1 IcmK [Xenorhabdus sp. KJ12.1]
MKVKSIVIAFAALFSFGVSAEEVQKNTTPSIQNAVSMDAQDMQVNSNTSKDNQAEKTRPTTALPSSNDVVRAAQHNTPTKQVTIESVGELPPLPDDLQSLVEPITPNQIRTVKQKLHNIEEAVNEIPYSPIPKVSSQTVSLSAGSAIPQVRIYKGVTTTITFSDITGQPWKILVPPVNSNSQAMKSSYIPESPIMFIQPLSNYVNGNVTVALEGLPTPITVNVITATPDRQKKTVNVDYRLDLRIPKRSPNALTRTPTPTQKIDLYSKELQAFVDGVPPENAKKVKLKNAPANTEAWLMGDELVIRTDLYLRDEFSRTLTAIDGTHVYVLDITPEILLSDLSTTRRVMVDVG